MGEPNRFDHFVAIDWSGAVGPRQPGIAVALCGLGGGAPVLVTQQRGWSREAVLQWLRHDLPDNSIVGLDLGASLPFADAGAFFPGWDRSPPNARRLWALIDEICTSDPNLGAASFVADPVASLYFRRNGVSIDPNYGVAPSGRLRVTEKRSRAQNLNPYSNFNLVGAAQVGKSSLTGMRLLNRLSGTLPIWPFDPLPASGSVVVEIYTSIAARDGGLPKGRAKMRDAAALDDALIKLDCTKHAPLAGRYTDHATDAILTAAWLRKVADNPALWHPEGLADVAQTEGWTFGVK